MNELSPLDKYAREGGGSHSNGCACARCRTRRREAMVETLARDSLRTALYHAQADTMGMEAPIRPTDADFKKPSTFKAELTWEPSVRLSQIADKTNKEKPVWYTEKWDNVVYRFWDDRVNKALYIGSATGTNTVTDRINAHIRDANKPQEKITRGSKSQQRPFYWFLGHGSNLDHCMVQVCKYKFMKGENGSTFVTLPRNPALTVAVEKALHGMDLSRYNRPQHHRAEQDDPHEDGFA
jgi:hypothetical protein